MTRTDCPCTPSPIALGFNKKTVMCHYTNDINDTVYYRDTVILERPRKQWIARLCFSDCRHRQSTDAVSPIAAALAASDKRWQLDRTDRRDARWRNREGKARAANRRTASKLTRGKRGKVGAGGEVIKRSLCINTPSRRPRRYRDATGVHTMPLRLCSLASSARVDDLQGIPPRDARWTIIRS